MDKASDKSVRITAMDTEDQGVKVFLISVGSAPHSPPAPADAERPQRVAQAPVAVRSLTSRVAPRTSGS